MKLTYIAQMMKDAISKAIKGEPNEVESLVTIVIKTDTNEDILRTVTVPGKAISISLANCNTSYGIIAKKDIEL